VGGVGAGGGGGVGGVGGGVGEGVGEGAGGGVGGGVGEGVGAGKSQAHSSPAVQNAPVTDSQSRKHSLLFTSKVGKPLTLPSPLLFS